MCNNFLKKWSQKEMDMKLYELLLSLLISSAFVISWSESTNAVSSTLYCEIFHVHNSFNWWYTSHISSLPFAFDGILAIAIALKALIFFNSWINYAFAIIYVERKDLPIDRCAWSLLSLWLNLVCSQWLVPIKQHQSYEWNTCTKIAL